MTVNKYFITIHCFAKAIARSTKKEIILSQDEKVWFYYRLGMYKTASNFPNESLECKGLFAKIVSLAACGEFEKAEATYELFIQKNGCKKQYVPLVDALAPFMPKLALSLLDKSSPSLTLHAAVLLKLGEFDKAYSLLKAPVENKAYRKYPEQLLYLANATRELEPKKELTLVNTFLLMFNIPKLVLKDKNLPFSTLNITCRTKTKSSGPLVTIIMTTYKTGHLADVAIESILNQTYQNIELMVVDDASDDDTPEIIKQWMKRDKRVKLLPLQQNVGTYVAKNIALLQAKGEFVTCHDSDDWSHPLKIERQVRPLIKNRRLVATISSWVRVDENGEFYARPVHPLMRQNPSSLMFRREKTLKKAGIWDCVRTGADSEFIARLKLVFGRGKVKRIKEPLSFGAHRSDSLMNATDTGYCDLGMSPQRLEYWESWGQWHIDELSKGHKPFVAPDLLAPRAFDAPNAILVEKEKINSAWNSVK